MVKKISILILSAAILVIGYIAFSKLNYWERSTRIFSINNVDQSFEGRMGRGHGGFEAGGERPVMRDRNIPDSLRQQFRRTDRGQINGVPFQGGIRNGAGRGRGDFPGSKKVNLRNVLWFVAVFASFGVISTYLDKVYCLIIRRKKLRSVGFTKGGQE